MNKRGNIFGFVLGFAIAAFLCSLCGPTLAALMDKTINVQQGVKVYLDDQPLTMRDANGNRVDALLCNGTTYLPTRATARAVGQNIVYDPSTGGVYIGSHRSSIIPNNIYQGYINYHTAEYTASSLFFNTVSKDDVLTNEVSSELLIIAWVDLILLPLNGFSNDPSILNEPVLSFYQDIKVTGSDKNWTMTYKERDGGNYTITCFYDVDIDQLSATIRDSSENVSMFFEYVNLGNGTYVSQAYYPLGKRYEILRSYISKDSITAYGILSADKMPDSLIGKTDFSVDFVKNEERYMYLKDGKLTVVRDGIITTY